jgi:hypothetical protein
MIDAVMSQAEKAIADFAALLVAASPGATVQLLSMFVSTRIKPTEHEWYYGAECGWCHRASAAVHDPNDGQKRLRFSGAGGIRFHCHHCNALLTATAPQIVWFQFEG